MIIGWIRRARDSLVIEGWLIHKCGRRRLLQFPSCFLLLALHGSVPSSPRSGREELGEARTGGASHRVPVGGSSGGGGGSDECRHLFTTSAVLQPSFRAGLNESVDTIHVRVDGN